jgi:type II secretion system protein G
MKRMMDWIHYFRKRNQKRQCAVWALPFFIIWLGYSTAGCGGGAPQNELDGYRIQIGEKDFTFKQQMLYVSLSLELYRIHVGTYPSAANNLEALIAQPAVLEAPGVWRGPYAVTDKVFIDPWGRKLIYRLDENNKADLRSLGKDGVPSADDIIAKDLFPDIYREMEKLPVTAPTIIQSATP